MAKSKDKKQNTKPTKKAPAPLDSQSFDESKIYFVYSTFASQKEAKGIAEKLINAGLIACANIHGDMLSVYKWKGELEIADEVSAYFKTVGKKVFEVIHLLRQIHPYEVPCISVLETHFVNEEYAEWIFESTK